MAHDDESNPSGPSEFGVWLNEARNKKKMSVEELAKKSGVSNPAIYFIENGDSQNPREITRKRLIAALGEEPKQDIVKATEQAAKVLDVGEFADFDPHDKDDLPDEPGIYVFYDISERPIYIGQSKNIRARIRDSHRDRFWFRRPIVERAGYIKIKEAKLRKKIERVLIRFLKSNAVLNKQNVDRDAPSDGDED